MAVSDSEEESDHADDMDEAEFERQRMLAQKKGSRCSISADCGRADLSWKPPVHPKTEEQLQRIMAALESSFLFASLPPDNLKQVIDAFSGPHVSNPGVEIIQQGAMVESGEPGLFVLEAGTLDVFRTDGSGPKPGKCLCSYTTMGQVFGELALLYNAPRAATVIARTSAVLWAIDRDTFNNCVKTGWQKMREDHSRFIDSVPLLQHVSVDERQKLVDVLQVRTFHQGDKIIQKGDPGDEIFIVKEGMAAVLPDGIAPQWQYEIGTYFGELALRNKAPRAATIVAERSPTVCVALGGDTFRRLCVGKLAEELDQLAAKYETSTTEGSSMSDFIGRILGLKCCAISKGVGDKQVMKG